MHQHDEPSTIFDLETGCNISKVSFGQPRISKEPFWLDPTYTNELTILAGNLFRK